MIVYFIIMGISLFFGTFTVMSIPLFWFDLVAIALIPIAMKKKKIIIDEIVVLLFFIFIQNLFLAFNSTSLTFFQGVKNSFVMLMIYISINLLVNKISLNKRLTLFLIFLFIFGGLSLVSILNIVLTNNLYSETSFYMYKGLFNLPYGESNYIASFFLFIGLLLLSILFNKEQINLELQPIWFRFLFYVFLIVSPIVILILNSRASIIAYIITFSLVLLFKYKKNKVKSIVFLVFLFIIFILISKYTNFIGLLNSRIIDENVNVEARLNQYAEVIETIKHQNISKLLFGNGFGIDKFTFGILIHSLFLKIIYSYGVIGLIIQLYIYLKTFFISNKIFAFPMVGLAVVSMAEPVLFTGLIDYVIVISLATFTYTKNTIYNDKI